MSHPRVVQACRFYNTSYIEQQQQERPEEPVRVTPPYATCPTGPHLRSREAHETALHPPHRGEVGYHHSLQRKVDPSLLLPPQSHHLTYGPAMQTASQQRSNVFTKLPGRTFNADTWRGYQQSATLSLRARSPIRKRGVV